MSTPNESQLQETRVFKPSKEFSRKARVKSLAQYRQLWEESVKRPDKFWAREAAELLWNKKWTKVLDWKVPFAKWFVGGELNVSHNCLDRHVQAGDGDRVAYHWEGEPGDTRTITYAQLQTEVCRTANALLSLGLKAGDRVVYSKYAGTEVKLDNEEFVILKQNDILAIVK
jgi:acetyl-CoA synthetase